MGILLLLFEKLSMSYMLYALQQGVHHLSTKIKVNNNMSYWLSKNSILTVNFQHILNLDLYNYL